MADTTDLKSVGASREGSSPSFATNLLDNLCTFRQAGKARVCKTLMRWFESNKVLQLNTNKYNAKTN